jgi:amidohydrolase
MEMGLKVDTGIAKTGVIGVLDTGKPGPTIGLRADIDGLPVIERADLPFKSIQKSEYLGKEVGVMHACGHDTHIAMLLGAAKILTSMKNQLSGKFVFVFQPAEEGAPPGEEGGAKLMVKEGIFETYGIDVFFGQHIKSDLEVGKIIYKVGGMLAAADRFTIKVKGKQTHGSRPWKGVDPIVTSAQIIMGLQTIVSRQTELTKEAAVITIGVINGGVRNNIIPEEVEMIGTIRTLDTEMQEIIHEKIRKTATLIAEAQGATAEVDIQIGYPVTYNDPELTKRMIGSLFDAAGEDNVHVTPAITGAEDFSFFAKKVPSLFYFVGGQSLGGTEAFPHHTPDFYIDESGLITGVKSLCHLAIDYMSSSEK